MSRLPVALALCTISLALGCGGDSTVPDSKKAGGIPGACAQIPPGRVAALVRASGGSPGHLRRRARGSAELGRCAFTAPGVNAELSLDANHEAVRGYFNRMTEFAQFSSNSPDLRPQPVAGLGDRGTPGHGANWVPGLDQLFSVRDRKLLIATFYARGVPEAKLQDGAIELSQLAYAALGLPRAAAG